MKQRVPDVGRGRAARPLPRGAAEVGSRGAAERLLEAGASSSTARRRRRASGSPAARRSSSSRRRARSPSSTPRADGPAYRLRGRAPAGGRQAGRARRAPGAGHATGTLVQGLLAHGIAGGDAGAARHRPPARPRHLGAAWSSRARRRRTQRLQELVREPRARTASTSRSSSDDRDRAAGRIEAPIGRDRRDPLRQSLDTDTPRDAITHFEVEELLRAPRAPARAARDRADPPDPRAPRGDRSAGRRRHRLRRPRELGLRAPVPARGAARLPAPFTGERVDVESPLPARSAAALDAPDASE